MADYLKEFIEGETIYASDHNSNNQYLLDQIGDRVKELNTKINSIQSNLQSQLNNLYPVGAIYLGITDECPLAALFGTWEKLPPDLVLQTSGTWKVGTNVPQALPDHYHTVPAQSICVPGGIFGGMGTSATYGGVSISKASSTNSTYTGNRVQPPAITLNAWKRTA